MSKILANVSKNIKAHCLIPSSGQVDSSATHGHLQLINHFYVSLKWPLEQSEIKRNETLLIIDLCSYTSGFPVAAEM